MAKIKNITLKLNRRSPETDSQVPEVKASDLPTLISEQQFNILTEGDDDPFIFAQAIPFPVEGNGDVYGEEFFKSFLERNKARPFPGDKYGHSGAWYSRQATHFYQIGGEIKDNVAYFKLYVPPKTDSEENTSFIKDIKTNGVDLSLVSKVSYMYNQEDEKYHILSSEGSERNDAVGYGDGSMEQVVFNNKNDKQKESLGMDEILKKLNALREDGNLSIPQLLEKLNASKFLKTDEDEANLKVYNSLVKELGSDPLAKLKEMKDSITENADKVREAALTEAFGTKLNADGKTENEKRVMAETLMGDKEVNAENIEAVKKNSLYIKIAGQSADVNHEANSVVINNDGEGGIKEDSSSFSL